MVTMVQTTGSNINKKLHNVQYIFISSIVDPTDQTNTCQCKTSADCATPGLDVCVLVGDDVTGHTQTMSECEAGLRRCKGEELSVVSILPCVS